MTAMAKPARLSTIVDPQFGTTIRRITDVAAQFSGSKVCKPAYSTVPAWNCDESLLVLYIAGKGHALFNGKTYDFIRQLDIQPTDLEHFYWSATDQDVMFYSYAWEMSGKLLRQLIKYHVAKGTKEVVYDIPNATDVDEVDFGGDPVYCAYNNDRFGFRKRGKTPQGFTLKLSTKTESPRIRFDGAPQVSPSGRYALLGSSMMDAATLTKLWTREMDPNEHGTMVRLPNGQDVWAACQFDGAKQGTMVTENLDTAVVSVVIGPVNGYPYPPSGTHLSGHAINAPGLVAISVTGNRNGKGLLDQELLLVNLATNTVYRVGRHRSAGGDGADGYWAEPHVNISPSGKRLLFGSDWGGGATVDSYVVEL